MPLSAPAGRHQVGSGGYPHRALGLRCRLQMALTVQESRRAGPACQNLVLVSPLQMLSLPASARPWKSLAVPPGDVAAHVDIKGARRTVPLSVLCCDGSAECRGCAGHDRVLNELMSGR